MITLDELNEAICECENDERHTYDICIRLAALYTIRHQLYGDKVKVEEANSRALKASAVGDYGDTEFLFAIKGKPLDKVMLVFDELMTALEITNPRLYDGVMRKIDRE